SSALAHSVRSRESHRSAGAGSAADRRVDVEQSRAFRSPTDFGFETKCLWRQPPLPLSLTARSQTSGLSVLACRMPSFPVFVIDCPLVVFAHCLAEVRSEPSICRAWRVIWRLSKLEAGSG